MYKYKTTIYSATISLCLLFIGCKMPAVSSAVANNAELPATYQKSTDTVNMSSVTWKNYFKDPYLVQLIDTALVHNQELLITLQEVEMAKNDIRVRKGELLPSVGIGAGAGVEKVGRYTSQGAGDATTEIMPGMEFPEPLTDFRVAAYAHWEIDIWKKLRSAKKAAITRYLATIEGKNFVITNLVSEIARSYYELKSYDNQLEIVRQNIELQKNALEIVKAQKEAARATELAVQKFQAEVFSSQHREFDLLQAIKETENKINFLLGRYPVAIPREKVALSTLPVPLVQAGIPAQLLANRPDIKQAELELAAAKLDVKVARAEFYPTLGISATYGLQAFRTKYLFQTPESLVYSFAGDIAAPLINRNAIKAEYKNANARQVQALYNYQRAILNAYMEVSNQLSKISNLEKSYQLKFQQVEALNRSISASNELFVAARVDYFEVLMTQRDALETQLELVETKKDQLNATVQVYRDLGGGWK
jgi:NodT family efflux transporter outer membrane factor (OMF) lipoprotein